MRSGEGFLLVYSITSRSSFEEIATFHQQVLRVKDRNYFPMVMVANKCDLDAERQVSTEGTHIFTHNSEGYAMARDIGCPFVETSAKLRVNVDEAFTDLVREIRRFHMEPAPQSQAARAPAVGHGAAGPTPVSKPAEDAVSSGCKCVVM